MASIVSVVISNRGSGRVIDLPDCDTTSQTQISLWERHDGESQHWIFRQDGTIASGMDSNVVIDVLDGAMEDKTPIVIAPHHGGDNQKWNFRYGFIECMKDQNFVLSESNGKLVLERKSVNFTYQKWECLRSSISIEKAIAKPATTCHLRYALPDHIETSRVWVLKNSIRVKRTTNCTYNCVVGWGPGGTSGLQQLDNSKRVAVFSMWNHGNVNVELVHTGPGVRVEKFRSEGTGFKSIRDVHWREEEVITFWVKGELLDDNEHWQIYCTVETESECFNMATFRRKGPRPLEKDGFHSFIEDWNRSTGAAGHTVYREAEFFNTDAQIDMVSTGLMKEARFTKVKTGKDSFAVDKAVAGTRPSNYGDVFFLQTGGTPPLPEKVDNGTVFRI